MLTKDDLTLVFVLQRGGYMYGKVDEEGNVQVEFIYEPPQEGTEDDLKLLANEEEQKRVDFIAATLGLERVGWIFSQTADVSALQGMR